MSVRRPSVIPAGSWPPRMLADLAAGYCGERYIEDFLDRVGTVYPNPRVVDTTRRKFWYRDDLDQALSADRLATPSDELAPHACSRNGDGRFVHKVTKRLRSGKAFTYFFYTRHRNTSSAWPSIRLPEPDDRRYGQRLDVCNLLDRDDKGFTLDGIRLPDHRERNFWHCATEAMATKFRREREGVKDFQALIDGFINDSNPAWSALAASTQRGYRASGDLVLENWSSDMPRDLTTVDAQLAIDQLGDTPATANQFRAFLSRLMAWGVPRGFCKANVIEHTEKIPGGEPWMPWPNWAFELLFEHAPFHLQMIAVSAFFTGQRQGDVIAMKKPKAGENVIEVKAQKTGGRVWIPIHSEYQGWIARTGPGGVYLHEGARSCRYRSSDGFRTEWQKMMDRAEFKPLRENRIVFHGLRKNAVINLLEVGCTESQTGAICNMSTQMVQHYGKEVSSRALARDAMKLLEARWSEIRPAAFRLKGGAPSRD